MPLLVFEVLEHHAVPVRRHVAPHHRGRRARDDEADRQPADDAQLRRVPGLSHGCLRPAPRAARQAGCRQGHAGRAPRRALRRRAPLDRRALPRRGGAGHARSGSRPSATWTPASSCPTRSSSAWSRSASPPGGPLGRRLRARRLPAHAGARRRSSSGCSTAARSTSCSTSTCPPRSCSTASPGRRVCVNCGATYHVNMPPDGRLDVRRVRRRGRAARRRHRGGGRPPARALRAARPCRSSTSTATSASSSWSTASATATTCSGAPRQGDRRALRSRHDGDHRARTAEQIALMRRAGRGGRRDARGRAPARRSRARPRSTSTRPPARCSSGAAPARTSSATTASRRWSAPRPTT